MAHSPLTRAQIPMAYLATCLAQGPAAGQGLRLDAGACQTAQAASVVAANTTGDEHRDDYASPSKSAASMPTLSAYYAVHWH